MLYRVMSKQNTMPWSCYRKEITMLLFIWCRLFSIKISPDFCFIFCNNKFWPTVLMSIILMSDLSKLSFSKVLQMAIIFNYSKLMAYFHKVTTYTKGETRLKLEACYVYANLTSNKWLLIFREFKKSQWLPKAVYKTICIVPNDYLASYLVS